MNKHPSHHQHGIAVISAMLLAALVTTVIAQVLWQQRLLISELENRQDATQATWIANAAINWSRALLAEDSSTGPVDHGREIWATPLPPTPVEGGRLSGTIIDQQQFFNLNNVVIENRLNTAQLETLQRMLEKLKLKSGLAGALVDWLDTDNAPLSITNLENGAEDDYYLGLTPPYRTANQPLTEPGNLIRIKGMDAASVNRLSRFATALPAPTSININTASAEVLSFVLPGISLEDAQDIVASRNLAFFTSVGDFRQRFPDTSTNTAAANLSVNSHYFLVTCFAQFGRSQVKTEALLFRDDFGWPTVVWKR